MSDPFSDANNYNAVKTLAGYKIKSGNVGDYVYKDTEYTLALKPAGGGGATTWTVEDSVPNSAVVNNGDTVRWDAGNINTTIALSGAAPLHILTQSCIPSGVNRDIQINLQPSNTFGPGALPAQIDIAGNLTLTAGATTGEFQGSGFVPATPLATDTVDGATVTIAGDPTYEAKLYKKTIEKGSLGAEAAAPFNQVALAGYSTGTPGYGFPAQNKNIVWTGSNHQINGFNGILGYNAPDATAKLGFDLAVPTATITELAVKYGQHTTGPPASDTAYYDPLNMRALQGQPWSGGTAGSGADYTAGYNELSLGTPGLLRITVEVDGYWSAAPPINADGNELGVWFALADTAGVMRPNFPKRLMQNFLSYPVTSPTFPNQQIFATGTAFIWTYDKSGTGYDYSWNPDDTFKIYLNVPTQSNSEVFTTNLFKVAVEYVPNA